MITPAHAREPTVLLVDDDEVDIMAVRRAFRDAGMPSQVEVARDGHEALEALRGTGGRRQVPSPRVVLLDLNMPRMTGFGFLEQLRNDPELRSTVVFVLTSSDAEEDVVRAYALHVAGYVLKSKGGEAMTDLVRLLHRYWRMVALP